MGVMDDDLFFGATTHGKHCVESFCLAGKLLDIWHLRGFLCSLTCNG